MSTALIVENSIKYADKDLESSVGAMGEYATEYTISSETYYSSTLSETYTISADINLDAIPSDKKTFSIKRVGCMIKCHINKSYTMENQAFVG